MALMCSKTEVLPGDSSNDIIGQVGSYLTKYGSIFCWEYRRPDEAGSVGLNVWIRFVFNFIYNYR